MSDADPISTRRRLEYALGYLALGMIDAAANELEAVGFVDRFAPEVMEVRLQLHTAAGHWDVVANYARVLIQKNHRHVQAWVSLGCAIRRIKDVAAARDTLLEAQQILGFDHAIIHFNLACYHCLVGQIDEAKDRLADACRLEVGFKSAALDDPDLKAMWKAIESMQ
jgi:hypothetical protein